MRFKFYCDKLLCWVALGISFNWDDGVYFGVYLVRWQVGIQWYQKKQAVVKTEDLRKDL
jgi:hypothetical protein